MDNHNFAKEFLGVGWKFPVEVDETTGRIRTSSYEEDIKEAIKIIMMTRKGERMMMPDFGCEIHNYVFETMDVSVLVRMEEEILRALIMWEPRIIEPEVSLSFFYSITQITLPLYRSILLQPYVQLIC